MPAQKGEYVRAALSVRYASVIFPFDIVAFLKAISRHGYLLPEPLLRAVLSLPAGARLEPSGVVATRGEVAVALNTERQTLVLHGPEPQEALGQMHWTEELLNDQLGFDSPSLAQFYEFTAGVSIKATKNPLDSWKLHMGQLPFVQHASEIVGTNVAPFGLRLFADGHSPTEAQWFDIRIEPQVQNPATHHYVEIVFRHPARDELFDFVRGLDDTLRKLLSLLEGGHSR